VATSHSRREILRAGGLVVGGALVAGAFPLRAATAGTVDAATAGTVDPGAPGAGAAAATPPTFTTMTAATKVAARTDRRPVAGGVYDADAKKTFICWGGKNEDTYVQAYDHGAGTWSKPAKVMSGGGDSHNYPTMVQANDGRVLIFVGTHNDQLVMARSAQPHAITGTWTVKPVKEGPAASYPMPLKTANGDIFVFYRETTQEIQSSAPTDTRPMLYVRSTDNGVTWKSSKTLTGKPFAFGATKRSDHLNEVYMGQLRLEPATAGRPERLHLLWTIAGGGPSKHTHDAYHKDIYYATFDPATLNFRTVTGEDLGPQLDDAEYDKTRVLTTALAKPGGLKSPDYIQLVGWLPDGNPFLVWITSDTKALLHNTAAVWTGSAWQTKEVATGLRTRDMEQIGPTTWRVYANREGTPNIETYLLESGQTWTTESVIRTAKEVQRIEVIGNFRDPARILASGASSARSVSTADGDIYVAGLA
jgi:BNR repeat-containing family member